MFEKYSVIRFQNCPWYVRLWRFRFYLLIPFLALRRQLVAYYHDDNSLTFNEYWKIEIGVAQCAMLWYYDSDEVFDKIRERFK